RSDQLAMPFALPELRFHAGWQGDLAPLKPAGRGLDPGIRTSALRMLSPQGLLRQGLRVPVSRPTEHGRPPLATRLGIDPEMPSRRAVGAVRHIIRYKWTEDCWRRNRTRL